MLESRRQTECSAAAVNLQWDQTSPRHFAAKSTRVAACLLVFLSPLSPNARFPVFFHFRIHATAPKPSSFHTNHQQRAYLIHFITFDHLIMTGREYPSSSTSLTRALHLIAIATLHLHLVALSNPVVCRQPQTITHSPTLLCTLTKCPCMY